MCRICWTIPASRLAWTKSASSIISHGYQHLGIKHYRVSWTESRRGRQTSPDLREKKKKQKTTQSPNPKPHGKNMRFGGSARDDLLASHSSTFPVISPLSLTLRWLIPLDGAYHGFISMAFQLDSLMNHKMSVLLQADLWRDPRRWIRSTNAIFTRLTQYKPQKPLSDAAMSQFVSSDYHEWASTSSRRQSTVSTSTVSSASTSVLFPTPASSLGSSSRKQSWQYFDEVVRLELNPSMTMCVIWLLDFKLDLHRNQKSWPWLEIF